MAMFREHIAIGAVLSMTVVTIVYFYALVTDPLLLAILFFVTTVGSFLPDVDSDSGLPFYLVYGTASLCATGLVFLYTLAHPPEKEYLTYAVPLIALFFFWFGVGGVIKHWTHHRGIYHSLPAMVIAALATLILARHMGLDDATAAVFAVAMGIGFASHLVLDELHSGVSSEGIPFIPKKSLGTALKLFSDSQLVNVATYGVLLMLVYVAIPKA
jgi:hypothetical protein